MQRKTHSVKAAEIVSKWWLVDASGQTLGRLATQVASTLMGKGKPNFAPHLEIGDHVVVVNAERVATTGNKLNDKIYYRHSGYPGGLKSTPLKKMLATHPDRVISKAVGGMLPKNTVGRHALKRLYVYAGPLHPHAGQSPAPLTLGGNHG